MTATKPPPKESEGRTWTVGDRDRMASPEPITDIAMALQMLEGSTEERPVGDVLRLVGSQLDSQPEPRQVPPAPPPWSRQLSTAYRRPSFPFFTQFVTQPFDGAAEDEIIERERDVTIGPRLVVTATGRANRDGDMRLAATITDGPPVYGILEMPKLIDPTFGVVYGDREVVETSVWHHIPIPSHATNAKVDIRALVDVPRARTSSNPFAGFVLDSEAPAVAVTASLGVGGAFMDDQGVTIAIGVSGAHAVFRAHRYAGDSAPRITQPVSSSIALELTGTAAPSARTLHVAVYSFLTVERMYLSPPAPPVQSNILIGNFPGEPTFRLREIAVEGR